VGYTEEATAKIAEEGVCGWWGLQSSGFKTSAFEHSQNGGQNRQVSMMSVRTFKRFCMLAKTGKRPIQFESTTSPWRR
jgi:hypothetical protein